jgi:hypothetical protein
MKLALMKSFLLTLTRGNVAAITLFPFGIYFKNDYYLNSPRTKNHEKIHWKQQIGMFIAGLIMSLITLFFLIFFGVSMWWLFLLIPFPLLFFYLWYVSEWFIKLFIYGEKAYKNISYEREAYSNENNFDYHKIQKYFSWLKYIFKAS